MLIGAETVFMERINKEKIQTSKVLTEGTHKLLIRLEINDFFYHSLKLDTNEGYTLIISEENDHKVSCLQD